MKGREKENAEIEEMPEREETLGKRKDMHLLQTNGNGRKGKCDTDWRVKRGKGKRREEKSEGDCTDCKKRPTGEGMGKEGNYQAGNG